MSDRNGVEIDYCPECRGVWLDRGELDKIMERSSQIVQKTFSKDTYQQPQNSNQYGQNSKKKDSFLGDLFDF